MQTTLGLVYGIMFVFAYASIYLNEIAKIKKGKKLRDVFLAFNSGHLIFSLLLILILAAITGAISHTFIDSWKSVLSTITSVFILLALYDTLLLLFLPLLRKYLSSYFLYMIWFLPCGLYIFLNTQHCLSIPKYVIRIPEKKWIIFAVIWGIGTAVVLAWRVLSHISFSRRLLTNAEPVLDEDVLSCYDKCREKMKRLPQEKKIPLYYSDCVVTPLTIGVFKKKIILPKKKYRRVELRWIFYHELMHIVKDDIGLKLFITVCIAICWFVPTTWILLAKVSEDIELSCDELVLDGVPEETRRMYANLILKTGGSAKGFTTCLSATGASMRYRLKNILHPKKRRMVAETILGMLIMFLLVTNIGIVQIAFKNGSAKDMLFGGRISNLEIYTTDQEDFEENENDKSQYYQKAEKKIKEFLENETLSDLPGMDDTVYFENQHRVQLSVNGQDYSLEFENHLVEITYFPEDVEADLEKTIYYMPDKNWEKLF